MYYKSVNRGLTFTKSGRYAVGLIFLMGLLAVMSGLNAFFLFLGLGLGMLVVSGVLSEKQISYVSSQALEFRQADAGQSFSLPVRLHNRHPRHHLYGIASLGFHTQPNVAKRRWPAHQLESFALKVPAGDTIGIEAQVQGLARGIYRQLHMLHKTAYPFGLMEKFKLEAAPCLLRIVPPHREDAAAQFRQQLRDTFARQDQDGDFYGHRAYQGRESLGLIDWKKSARQAHNGWLVKRFVRALHAHDASLETSWPALLACPSPEIYENALADLRTLCDILRDEGYQPRLHIRGQRSYQGYDEALDGLAMLPAFGHHETKDEVSEPSTAHSHGMTIIYHPGQGIQVHQGDAS